MNRNQNISAILPESETLRYQYSNHLGSACLELDGSADIISYEEYHPFGTKSYRSGRNEVDVSLKRYKYVGKERDEETGLYYYGARYYAAWLCRFVSVDQLAGKALSWSGYSAMWDNPIKNIDPDGNWAGDFWSQDGIWLGSDDQEDNKSYVVKGDLSEFNIEDFKEGGKYFNNIDLYNSEHEKTFFVKNDTFWSTITDIMAGRFAMIGLQTSEIEQLPITNTELLNRANWVYGECSGNDEICIPENGDLIINGSTENKGIAARVVDYYAHAMKNARKLYSNENALYLSRMSREEEETNEIINSYKEGYFQGLGRGGNDSSKAFAKARNISMTELMKISKASNAISSVILSEMSVGGTEDPTFGSRAWRGTYKYVKNVMDGNYSVRLKITSSGTVPHAFFKN